MKQPTWALPVIVIVFVAIRLWVASRIGRAERARTGQGWWASVPVWTKALWVLLAGTVVVLLFWSPKPMKPAAPGGATPAGQASPPP
jgi:hypothetical protein